MALTFTEASKGVMGDRRYWTGTVTFDSSYPTGGEAVTAADFGFNLDVTQVIVGSVDDAGFDVKWDAANSKLLVFDEDNTSGISAQAANASDQSGVVATVIAFGR